MFAFRGLVGNDATSKRNPQEWREERAIPVGLWSDMA